MWSQQEMDEREKDTARAELTKLEAAKILVTNNTIAAEMHIAGMVVGVSVNDRLLPVLDAEIDEINKFLAGELNNYE